MINEIFPFSTIEFERLLHLKFKNKNDISKMGINNYLLNYNLWKNNLINVIKYV